MDKQSMVLEIQRDGTLRLPLALRRILGNPQQLGVTRIGASLVLAPIPDTWRRGKGRPVHYEGGLIVRDPKVMFGTRVIAGTRIPVRTVVGYIESGYSVEQIRQEFPQLSAEQIDAALRFTRNHRKRRTRQGR
jgi:uncharacterized protein (DUF433 family)